MKPSRELDAAIAEKVLGLSVVRNKKGGWTIGKADYYDIAGETFLHNPLPAYSEDLSASMSVFEQLRNSGKYCCLKISSDYNYCWYINLTKSNITDLKSDEDHGNKPCISVTDESLPMAICKAALKTVEV